MSEKFKEYGKNQSAKEYGKDQFAVDLRNVKMIVNHEPPPVKFIDEMQCYLCQKQTIGLPSVSSGWRIIEIKNKEFHLCKYCLPSVVASTETWHRFYVKTVFTIWQKEFKSVIEEIIVFVDRTAAAKKSMLQTESGSQFLFQKKSKTSGTLEELLKQMYEGCLPVLMSAFEVVTAEGGKSGFEATSDVKVNELDYSIHLKIKFEHFNGVTLEQIPESQKSKAMFYKGVYSTMELCVDKAIENAFAEMNRQNAEEIRQQFTSSADQLTFIDSFLFKVIVDYKFLFEKIDMVENTHLN